MSSNFINLENGETYQSWHELDKRFYESFLTLYDKAIIATEGSKCSFVPLDSDVRAELSTLIEIALLDDSPEGLRSGGFCIRRTNRGEPYVEGAEVEFGGEDGPCVFLPSDDWVSILQRLESVTRG